MEEIRYPYVVVSIMGELFSINSRYVLSIVQHPKEHTEVPHSPNYIAGFFSIRDQVITLLDLRKLLSRPALEEEYQDFVQMIDTRKQDHIRWVQELERCVRTGEPFTLATNHHDCALGRWRDSFESENQEVNFHLNQLDRPHQKLHESAVELLQCLEGAEGNICRDKVMHKLNHQFVPKILGLLDETKEVFSNTVFKKMVLVVAANEGVSNEKEIGIVVDEILGVEYLQPVNTTESLYGAEAGEFLSEVMRSDNMEGLIFDLAIPHILHTVRKDGKLSDQQVQMIM